jgi:hypothetical protein
MKFRPLGARCSLATAAEGSSIALELLAVPLRNSAGLR